MSESDLEKKCKSYSEKLGWKCYKFVSPGKRGVPDRIFLKGGKILFVEMKDADGVTRKQQNLRHKEIREAGFEVYVIDNFEDFRKIVDI